MSPKRFLPILFLIANSCQAFLSGPAMKDAIDSIDMEIEALESDDPTEREIYEHKALQEAIDASIEASESLIGLDIPVDVQL